MLRGSGRGDAWYVGHRHEYRYLHHLAVYMLLLVYNLGDYNATVTWREYKLVVVNLHSSWLTEEGGNEEPEYNKEEGEEEHKA